MSLIRTAAVGALAMLAGTASADLVTYQYNGTVHTNTHWGSIHGEAVQVSVTFNTSVAASSLTDNRAEYTGAIVGGYFRMGSEQWDIDTAGTRNSIILRTDVYDQNFDTYSNRYNLKVSVFDGDHGPWQYANNFSISITDNDDPRDTITGLDMLQPFETVRTSSQGGVDSLVVSMGIYNGVSATILSGDGGFTTVPAPAGTAVLGLMGLAATRRRRAI